MQNLVTVFGGSGFVGAQTVRQLAKAGWRIRVAVRNPAAAYAMRLHGDVGQIDIVQASVRNEPSLRRALSGATAAVNLVGVLRETGFQPVLVGDAGKALARIVALPEAAGQTYELGGPAVFTFRQLMELMLAEIGKRRFLASIPWPLAGLMGAAGDLAGAVIEPPVTADQVTLLKTDNVASGAYPGLTELGITPTTLEAVLPSYLYRYRNGGQAADQEDRELAAV